MNRVFPVNGEVLSRAGVVSSVSFMSGLRLGDIVLEKGLPPSSELIFSGVILNPDRSVSAMMHMEYPAYGFWVGGTLECPYTSNLWQTPVQLTITTQFNALSLGTVRPIDRKTFLDSIHRTSNIMCGM